MFIYLIREQGSFYEPKNLFTSNKILTHKEIIFNIKELFDVKFTDLGEFNILIEEKIHSIFYEKVLDPMRLVKVSHV